MSAEPTLFAAPPPCANCEPKLWQAHVDKVIARHGYGPEMAHVCEPCRRKAAGLRWSKETDSSALFGAGEE